MDRKTPFLNATYVAGSSLSCNAFLGISMLLSVKALPPTFAIKLASIIN